MIFRLISDGLEGRLSETQRGAWWGGAEVARQVHTLEVAAFNSRPRYLSSALTELGVLRDRLGYPIRRACKPVGGKA